jgi:iron complex outermembrane receptor protein
MPASAQTVAPGQTQAAKASKEQLETVVVTARKKAENLQKVPLTVTAISKKVLEQSHVQNLQDIGFLTPGILVSDFGSENFTSITVRGVVDLTAGLNVPDVATFLDGIYLREPAAIEIASAGLSQVEIIKGPSGALYGRDAYSGVINYLPDRPTSTPHANLDYTVGDYGKEQLVGNVSGPLYGDMIFGKLFGQFDNFDGTFQDPVSGTKAGGDVKQDIGGLLDINWTKELTTHFDLYYGYDVFNASPDEAIQANCGDISGGGQYGLVCGRIKAPDSITLSNNPGGGVDFNLRRTFYGSVRNSAQFDWGRIDSLTGASQVDEQAFGSFDYASLGRPYLLTNGKSVNEYENYGIGTNTGNFSEELRYTSPQDQRLRYGIGGYFYRERQVYISGAGVSEYNIPPGVSLANPFAPFFDVTTFATPTGVISQNTTVTHHLTTESAGFGNADFDILPNLTLSAQYRYTDLLQQFVELKSDNEPGVFDPFGPHISQTNQYFNTNDSIRWTVIPNAILYFTFANGTKPGGFNAGSTTPGDEAFGPETDTSFEWGTKTSWFDNRLRANLAIYHIATQNVQAFAPSSNTHSPAEVIRNFGSTTNTGGEAELSGKPTDDTTITFGADYNNPTFDNGTLDVIDNSYCAQIPSCAKTLVKGNNGQVLEVPIGGHVVPYSPRLTLTITGEYDFHFAEIYNGYARVNYAFRSPQSLDAAELWSVGSSSNLDFYTGISRGPYSLGAYVKNVTDNHVPVNFQYAAQLEFFQDVPVVTLPQGRTLAFTLGVHF